MYDAEIFNECIKIISLNYIMHNIEFEHRRRPEPAICSRRTGEYHNIFFNQLYQITQSINHQIGCALALHNLVENNVYFLTLAALFRNEDSRRSIGTPPCAIELIA